MTFMSKGLSLDEATDLTTLKIKHEYVKKRLDELKDKLNVNFLPRSLKQELKTKLDCKVGIASFLWRLHFLDKC